MTMMDDLLGPEDEANLISELTDDIKIPMELPLLPVRDVVVFPFMILPLYVGRASSINAVKAALEGNRMILLAAQKDASMNDPTSNDMYKVGTVAMVIRMLKLTDNSVKILVQGIAKASLTDFTQKEPFHKVKFKRIVEPTPKKVTKGSSAELKSEALMRNVRKQLEIAISMGKRISPDILTIAENIDNSGKLAELVAANLGLKVDDAQLVLETDDPLSRLMKTSELLSREIELLDMQQKIQESAQEEMSKSQREYYLREQLKAIQKELGDMDDQSKEISEFREKIEKIGMPEEVQVEAEKQLNRLSKMHSESAEATTVRTFLEWMVEIPWSKLTEDKLDIKAASKILDEDHYGLEKVKERILEYLAVRKLKAKMKGPILCFAGPPGVGKTSLGQSIARALGRKFIRISLGGVRDEAEIRGHRRTYIGALPGRIMQGIKQAGSSNPVFMMDEIDKLGSDFRGDPSSALLEVLDPAQNNSFVDHYLGVPFDLTNVMFITTANITEGIPTALLDRMEVINLSGYTEDEKVEIAVKYLVPRQLTEHGLTARQFKITKDALHQTIREYTREAGLRNLERKIASLCRKVAKGVALASKKSYRLGTKDLRKYLGVRIFEQEIENEKPKIGVATGVAWTMAGGEIMNVEATTTKGNGRLTLTGKLGDVMKESAHAALSFIRSRAASFGIDENFIKTTDVHVHVPAGAIPKDGPSAGVTIATAIVSALTNVPVRNDITMTGEITLRGRVLAIGGLKEKSLAAKRAGIQNIIIPEQNKKDLQEIPKNIRNTIKFHIVKTADQVLNFALTMKLAEIKKSASKKNGGVKKKFKKPIAGKSKTVSKLAAKPARLKAAK